jgi:hypothetical protein
MVLVTPTPQRDPRAAIDEQSSDGPGCGGAHGR